MPKVIYSELLSKKKAEYFTSYDDDEESERQESTPVNGSIELEQPAVTT